MRPLPRLAVLLPSLLALSSVPLAAGAASSTTTSPVPVTGRAPVTIAGGKVPSTGTTLPLAPTSIRLTQIAIANQPVALSARPGDDTLFLAQKAGRIVAIRSGALDPTPVLDLTAKVTSENERGMLGVAFKPDDPSRMFVDYTDLKGSVTVSEFPYDGTRADPTRERVLLSIAKPFNEHNAGTILFDSKGALLIAIGDGGGAADQYNNAQRTTVLLGKVLRITVDPAAGKPYGIPPDNPFVPKTGAAAITSKKTTTGRPEIYAYGLRNPWRLSIDRGTGDLWVPDVGQNLYEEINRMPAGTSGTNFGWKMREGKQAFNGGSKPIGAVDPVYDYPHKDGRCAVTGGFVYRGSKLPGLVGWYVFGDVCTGQLSALKPDGSKWVPMSLGSKVSYLAGFGEDAAGELYALSLEGAVSRIEPA